MSDAGTAPPAEWDEPLADPRAPLWARVLGFAVVLAFLVSLAIVVVMRDRHRDTLAGRAGTTARTVALAPDDGGTLVPPTSATVPPGTGPNTIPRSPRTNTEVSLALEAALKRDSGFSQKVSCLPEGALTKGAVLECHAASEPPIREAPPSTVLAVVIDDDGRFIYGRRADGSYTLASLTADPGLGCDALLQRGYPYAVVLAYFEANGRPAALDPKATGRPCEGLLPSQDIDAAMASAL